MNENKMDAATTLQERDWSSLPVDVLVLILARLRWSSHPTFGLACRQWQSARAYSPFYPLWITPLLLNAADVGTTSLRYYSPYYNKNFQTACTLNTQADAKICCSAAGGHLTLCVKNKVLAADLLKGDVGELPPITFASFDLVIYDDGLRSIFGIIASFGLLGIARCIRNETMAEWQDWEHATHHDPVGPRFSASPGCNPVFHNGLLYLLDKEGGLAVYDESMHDEGFEILEKPTSFGGFFECYVSYLVKSDQQELMAVLVGRRGTQVTVVKLNESTMEWEKIDSLQGRSIFTGTFSTTMKKTNINWMRNKIFLPRFHNWPETVHVHLVQRDGELAFVPNSMQVDSTTKHDNCATDMWTYELGQGEEEAREFWETEKAEYSIWVDFTNS